MRVLRNDTAGIIIDIQERLFPFILDNEQLTKNTGILIKGLQALKVPVVVTQQYTKGLGPTIQPLHLKLGDYDHIEKMTFSCCDEPSFSEHLDTLNKRFIIIAGIETHVCVLQTTIDLLESNYIPVIVQDCVSSRRLNDKMMAIERMRKEGAIITTCESVLFELLRYSGTAEFKEISKLVK